MLITNITTLSALLDTLLPKLMRGVVRVKTKMYMPDA